MKEYQLADYATYKVLYGLDQEKKGYVPRSRYYKAIYLLNLSLLKCDVDIQLPWRWYMYGPVVELDCIDAEVYNQVGSHADGEDESGEKLVYGEEPQVNAPYEIKRLIDREVDSLCNWRPKTIRLMDQAYETAPLPFIRTLRQYDEHVKSNFKELNKDPRVIDRCERLRQQMFAEYPMDRYREMYESALRITDLVRDARTGDAFEAVRPSQCTKELRRALAHGFSRDFHGHLPEYKVEKIKEDYERWIINFDDFVFERENDYYRAVRKAFPDHFEHEIEKLIG